MTPLPSQVIARFVKAPLVPRGAPVVVLAEQGTFRAEISANDLSALLDALVVVLPLLGATAPRAAGTATLAVDLAGTAPDGLVRALALPLAFTCPEPGTLLVTEQGGMLHLPLPIEGAAGARLAVALRVAVARHRHGHALPQAPDLVSGAAPQWRVHADRLAPTRPRLGALRVLPDGRPMPAQRALLRLLSAVEPHLEARLDRVTLDHLQDEWLGIRPLPCDFWGAEA